MSENGVDEEIDPARPESSTHLRMWTHIVQKGWQVGSVLGTAVVLPIAYYRMRGLDPALSAAGKTLPGGIALACATSKAEASHGAILAHGARTVSK